MSDNKTSDDLSKLGTAFDRASTSITRTGQAFGELAKSSQEWNIVSRILSGTGMWRLQNQIRAVGNIINVYHNRQKEAMKGTIEAIEANEKLADSIAEVQHALGKSNSDIAKTPLAMMFTKAGRDGIKEYKEMWQEAGKQLGKAEAGLAKSLTPSNTAKFLAGGLRKDANYEGGALEYMKRGFNDSRTVRGVRAVGRFSQKMYGNIKNIGMSKEGLALEELGKGSAFEDMYKSSSGRENKRARAAKAWAKFKTKMGGIGGKVAQFFVVGAAFLAKASLYFLLIITGLSLLIFIIKKLNIKKRLKAFEKRFGFFGNIFASIEDILYAVYDLFKAAFGGDWKGMKTAFKDLFLAWGKMLFTILKLVVVGLLQAIKFMIGGILKFIGNALPWGGGAFTKAGNAIAKMASGGVSSGGLTLVGERGPELVRLPSGSRVHSNAESRRMGGSNISVHVNGRVGASDSEIKDIADKVAREINQRMNRTAHTSGSF